MIHLIVADHEQQVVIDEFTTSNFRVLLADQRTHGVRILVDHGHVELQKRLHVVDGNQFAVVKYKQLAGRSARYKPAGGR